MADVVKFMRTVDFEDDQLDVEYRVIDGIRKGTKMTLASITSGDFIEWSEANEAAKRTAGLRLIVKSVVDGEPGTDLGDGTVATGARILSDKHLDSLKRKSHKETERVVIEILDLNGLKQKDRDKAKNDSGGAPTAS